ncbi:methyltransferase, TIGR04325 family [Gemmobacter sp. 24YEA27]|uniref:methyltransferase, TIGR04325 family n=1 Tax=Gemmobacter sp. 24YEA27 TaxID=3040672 RepID=UPI0024B335B2|nr:methyltransferase, TIGR04325 family [Gemmobacter sp. 24YEA27]
MGPGQGRRALQRAVQRHLSLPLRSLWNRALALTPAAPGFVGAWPTHAEAMRHIPKGWLPGYDHDALAETSFRKMCVVQLHDYPVLYWLRHHLRPGMRVLDLGGHLGTKFIAFAPHLPLEGVEWVVCDLPAIIAAARTRQARGELPAALRFESDPGAAGPADILLASGLFQYLDIPWPSLLTGWRFRRASRSSTRLPRAMAPLSPRSSASARRACPISSATARGLRKKSPAAAGRSATDGRSRSSAM